jgi:outer membrane receptor protein involved in Fe transport
VTAFVSQGNSNAKGIEFELAFQQANWSTRFNTTYTRVKSRGGASPDLDPDSNRFDEDKRGLNFPEWMANLAITYHQGPLSVSPSLRYIGPITYRALSLEDSPTGLHVHKQLPSSIQVGFNAKYQLTPKWRIRLQDSNIFDEDNKLPASVFNGVTEQYGRYWQIKTRYSF